MARRGVRRAGHEHLRTSLALDASEMATWTRKRDPNSNLSALVHQSDRGRRCLSIRYSERLAEEGAVASVGSRGDSYDDALAETVDGLFKTEPVRRRGPWRGLDDLELTTLEWVDGWKISRNRLADRVADARPRLRRGAVQRST